MKYWFDTEFIEYPRTIDLISIGIVAEDGREYYAESSEVDWDQVAIHHPGDDFYDKHIKPHLQGDGITRAEIRDQILEFIGDDEKPEFWAYYADYDWVVFCWLFGRMIDLPPHFPKWCRDIKQEAATWPAKLPEQTSTEHHALADARWNREAWIALHEHAKKYEAFVDSLI